MKNRWMKRVSVMLSVLMLAGTLFGCSGGNKGNSGGDSQSGDSGTTGKEVTLRILHNWNGSTGSDVDMDAVSKVIKEKTGVTVKWEYTNGSEVEKVNTIFATQDLPDIYTGPAWGGELDGIIKAAKEDQLVDLTDKLDKYPNLAKAVAK
jgi:putative aldouronate transport system substrate-binding protein